MPGVAATGTAAMSTLTSTVIPISTGTSTARVTGRIWKHVGKAAAEAPGSMTPATGGASRIEIKGRRNASTAAAMREPRRHVRLFVAGRRAGGKSWGVVARATGVVWAI